jgi:hypothetical protein
MTFAQFVGSGSTGVIGFFNLVVVPVIIALAFAAFVWGVVKNFFINGADSASHAKGNQFVLWGLIGLIVIFSVWGILNMLLSTLGVTPTA